MQKNGMSSLRLELMTIAINVSDPNSAPPKPPTTTPKILLDVYLKR